MKRGFILLLIINGFLAVQLTGQTEAVSIHAWIEKEEQSAKSKTEIRGMIANESNQEITLYHRLEVTKVGTSGTSRHQSKGSFTVAPQETKAVARSSFYSSSTQTYQVNFRIFNDLGEIFSDSLHYPTSIIAATKKEPIITSTTPATPSIEKQNNSKIIPSEKPLEKSSEKKIVQNPPPALKKIISTQKVVTKIPVDVLEIDGLIIDETRSKIARDFYDLFYKKWVPPSGASNYSLFVREAPSRGRGARVSLTLNEQKIFENFVPPRYDALEEVVNFAIRIARARLNTKKTINQQLNEEDQMGSGI